VPGSPGIVAAIAQAIFGPVATSSNPINTAPISPAGSVFMRAEFDPPRPWIDRAGGRR
jgi:hypothetical protein